MLLEREHQINTSTDKARRIVIINCIAPRAFVSSYTLLWMVYRSINSPRAFTRFPIQPAVHFKPDYYCPTLI